MTNKYKQSVACTLQFEALHAWPECDIEEVSFLRHPHRHIFHIKAYKEVVHGDRDCEFIVLKRRISEYLKETYPTHDFGRQSCEMIAMEIAEKFKCYRVEIFEDGENGGVVELI